MDDSNVTLADRLLARTRLSELSYLHLLRSTMHNWYDPMLVRAGIKKSAVLRFKDGSAIEIKKNTFSGSWSNEDMQTSLFRSAVGVPGTMIKNDTVSFLYKNRKLLFNYSKRAKDTFSILREVFIDGKYSFLDVQGRDVVDIGTYIGDTAIYFALNGARHVYAFEPDPIMYKLAKKNIAANGLGAKITLSPKRVVSGKASKQSISLEEMVHAYKLDSAVLKIDCEGHEYSILLGAKTQALQSFGQLQVECHMGYLNLEKRFKALGFKVTHDIPTKPSACYFGHLYARRN